MREKIIQLRMDEETKKLLQECADKQNIPLATFVRMIAVKRANEILSNKNGNQ